MSEEDNLVKKWYLTTDIQRDEVLILPNNDDEDSSEEWKADKKDASSSSSSEDENSSSSSSDSDSDSDEESSSDEDSSSDEESSSEEESSDEEESSEAKDPAEYEWETEGHRFIGKRVYRTFPNGQIAQGVVEKYVPSDGEDGALFHILHDDGDAEDLDETECSKAIEEHRRMNVTGRYNVRNRESVKPPERFTIAAIATTPGGRERKKKKKNVANRNAYERSMMDGGFNNNYNGGYRDNYRNGGGGRRNNNYRNRRRDRGGGSRNRRKHHRRHYDSSSESDSDHGVMGASNFRMYEKRRERDTLNSIQPINGRGNSKKKSGKASKRDISRADALPIQVDKSISWSSVGGLDKHVTALKEMVTLPLLYPEVFERFHITAPRGVIFHGPPGTGKTLLGKATAGGNLVPTELLAGSFIDILRKRMAVMATNPTMLTGLSGNVAIPRMTSTSTAYFVGESGAPTESQQAFDQVNMTPKTVGAFVDYSRRLLLQSSELGFRFCFPRAGFLFGFR